MKLKLFLHGQEMKEARRARGVQGSRSALGWGLGSGWGLMGPWGLLGPWSRAYIGAGTSTVMGDPFAE